MKSSYSHIAMLLDRSGSMESCAADTVGGFNSFIDDQKKLPGKATFTLVQFDDVSIDTIHNAIPIRDVPPLDFHPRGATPLLDALGKSIVQTGEYLSSKPERDRPEHVIFVILTDGQENSSREYNRQRIFEMIRHQEDVYKWTFIYLGANQDAIKEAGSIGIHADSSVSYDVSKIKQAYSIASNAVGGLRQGRAKKGLFSKKDRDDVV